jgi:hypothetical protein
MNLSGPLRYTYSSKDNLIWDSINLYQYGVAGSGFIGSNEFIGNCAAKYNDGGGWIPVTGYKQTLCGYLKMHSNFKENDDGDIDFFVIPDPVFRPLLFNSKRPTGHSYEHNAIGCEIAFMEPGNIVANDGAIYFQTGMREKMEFKGIGVYGAFVYDNSHGGNNPEIHPIEQMWHKEEISSTTTAFFLYSMHDNQDRFGRKEYYYNSNECPGLPWLKNPQVNVFYLPFEVSVNGSVINYNIELLSGNNINHNNTTGQTLRLLYNGKELITVKRPSLNYPVLTFYSLGMKDATTIKGYIAIETSIGNLGATRAHGGHLFLKATRMISPRQRLRPATQKIGVKQQ